jgi:hypothetical protein
VTPGDYYLVAFDHTESGGLPAADLPTAIIPLAFERARGSGLDGIGGSEGKPMAMVTEFVYTGSNSTLRREDAA